jgi:hypothetical protein
LLEAPDSLAEQSGRNPDGYGIGSFDHNGSPKVHNRPTAAYEDEVFAREAREEESPTFVAHVRYASEGARRSGARVRECSSTGFRLVNSGSRTSSRSRPPPSVTPAIAIPWGRRRPRLQ